MFVDLYYVTNITFLRYSAGGFESSNSADPLPWIQQISNTVGARFPSLREYRRFVVAMATSNNSDATQSNLGHCTLSSGELNTKEETKVKAQGSRNYSAGLN